MENSDLEISVLQEYICAIQIINNYWMRFL